MREARFAASLGPVKPRSLLALHTDRLMADLPSTPRALGEACVEEAKRAGFERVRIGNVHLLW